LQDEVAQKLKSQRFQHGALSLQTDELQPLMLNDQVVDVVNAQKNRATELIEDFMVAANGVVARLLEKVSSLRRIVRTPKRWDRIVQLAATKNEKLPAEPDSKALNEFLLRRKAADPDHFADVSLAVIKLIGPGEYVLERAGEVAPGHFGLAVQDYTHSTAPNRRFVDIVSQRILKAFLAGQKNPYSDAELTAIAANCTLKEDAAKKVERDMAKRLAAVALQKRIGEVFDAMVTGASEKGTFVRILQPRVEGLLVQNPQGLDVGDRLRVKLVRTDVQRGFIDFARV
jgi:exoribonuclease R